MTKRDLDWAESARVARSYRAMFALATEIVSCDSTSKELRRLARRVTRALQSVIDKPIASAAVLKRAQHFFSLLSASLMNEASKAAIRIPEGSACVEPTREPASHWSITNTPWTAQVIAMTGRFDQGVWLSRSSLLQAVSLYPALLAPERTTNS